MTTGTSGAVLPSASGASTASAAGGTSSAHPAKRTRARRGTDGQARMRCGWRWRRKYLRVACRKDGPRGLARRGDLAEAAGAEVLDGLHDLVPRRHDEGAVLEHRLVERLARHQDGRQP